MRTNILAIFLTAVTIFFISTGSINAASGQWSANGNIIHYIEGNVGIGTSTPSGVLDVSGSNSNTDTTTLSLSNSPNRNWIFINGKYTADANGNYPLTLLQENYPGCQTCKGDLILRPGRKVSIPWASVGIGTTNTNGYKLAVRGKIKTDELVVNNNWADYVFEKGYKLRTLEDVENFIKQNGHLPNIPSAKEVLEGGLSVGEMQKLQMEKIEELTLYLIQKEKEVRSLEERLSLIESKI